MKKVIYKMGRFFIKLILPFVRFGTVKIDLEDAKNEIGKIYEKKELFNEKDIQNLPVDENIDLSIIVPVYNSEKFLRKCMDSIVNQKTKYNFEVIAVNDGSTDNSLEILKEYENIIIVDKQNEGVAIARNEGLDIAKGKYVAFIDSDDGINEFYIEKLLSRAYLNNADIVKCNYVEYNVNCSRIIKYERHEDISIGGNLDEKITEFKGFVWGGIFRRILWNDVRFLPQYWYEDMIIRFIIFRKCNKFEYINEDLYIYNNHSNNISKSISRTEDLRCLDHLFLVKDLLKLSDKLGLKKDSGLYKILLQELGTLLWLRTRDLSIQNKKFAFVIACDIIQKYKVECELKFDEKYMEKAFFKRNYLLWKLISIYVMLGVKIGND